MLTPYENPSNLLLSRVEEDGVSEPRTVPLCSLAELKLRFLCPSDLPEVHMYKRKNFLHKLTLHFYSFSY